MSRNLHEAYRQWSLRPPDQRFSSLGSLYRFLNLRKKTSTERALNLNQMHLSATDTGSLVVNGNGRMAHLSNWSFWQLCSSVDAPAKYLRKLPAPLVQECLGFGLKKTNRSCKLLVRKAFNDKAPDDTLCAAAITGPTYGRIWDADVLEEVGKAIKGTPWHIPSLEDGNGDKKPNGLYASDRDMFIFLINDESPVRIGDAELKQGFFCWNSETGASSFGLMTFLYNTMCDNHIVWDAEDITEFRFQHRQNAEEYFWNEAMPMLKSFIDRSAVPSVIQSVVDNAMRIKIADGFEDLLEWAKDRPFSQNELQKAWSISEANGEKANTIWGLVQGLTNYAQSFNYMNKRVFLERRAGALLNQAA